jgi:hypothetical protein
MLRRFSAAVATSREGHRWPSASTCAFSDPFVLSFKFRMRHHTCTQGPMAYAYQPQLMILIYGRRRGVLLREQKHHHGSSFFPESVGSTIAHLQRQKPAMFAQMPLSVYRHFTGAVQSSDGRFASGLSNSSDMVRSPTFRSRSQLNWSPVQRAQFKTFCQELRLQS